jgi:hypothetical protein
LLPVGSGLVGPTYFRTLLACHLISTGTRAKCTPLQDSLPSGERASTIFVARAFGADQAIFSALKGGSSSGSTGYSTIEPVTASVHSGSMAIVENAGLRRPDAWTIGLFFRWEGAHGTLCVRCAPHISLRQSGVARRRSLQAKPASDWGALGVVQQVVDLAQARLDAVRPLPR